jgi:hypothetical protein
VNITPLNAIWCERPRATESALSLSQPGLLAVLDAISPGRYTAPARLFLFLAQ